MVDVHSSDVRRKNMQAIRGRDTKPELKLRKLLFREGFRYRITPANLPAKPDIYLPRYKAVILVNGCFWHGHDCYLFKLPKTRTDFWLKKISDNVKRDEKKIRELRQINMRVLVVWECAIKGRSKLNDETLIGLVIGWINSENRLSVCNSQGIINVREVEGCFSDCCGKVPERC
jgi:DNA mismatch endonuclease (patch repair protein)